MDNTSQYKTTIASFFSGYEGLGIGIKQALGEKARVIVACEIEAYACANLIAKMEENKLDACPIYTDMRTFPYRKFRGLVDIACGGVPCQPHSVAGKRKGGSDERFLFDAFFDGLAEMQPGRIFIENVEGLLTSRMPNGSLCFQYIVERLEKMDYRVKAGLFTAAEVGAPHRRKRVFILAKSKGWMPREQTEREGWEGFGRGSSEELENTSRIGRGGRNQGRGEVRECGMPEDQIEGSGSSPEVLGDSASIRSCGYCENTGTVSKDEDGEECRMCESSGTGALPGNDSRAESMANPNQPRPQGRNSGIMSERAVQWPARPGSPQYDWEEPRVIESGMGRAVNGATSRVDRLRLLGNGVVPQQAARAFTILTKQMEGEK